MPKKKSMAKAAPPPTAKNLFNGRLRAALLELVVMVRVEVPAVVAVTLAVVGLRLQATPLPLPVTAQVRATLPENPAEEVTEIALVAELPAVMEPEFGLADTAKLGLTADITITVNVVVGISLPEVPVTVSVYVPGVVVEVVLTVAVDVPAPLTVVGLKVTVGGLVAPDGPAVTAAVRATLPVKPLFGVTVIVEVFPLVAP